MTLKSVFRNIPLRIECLAILASVLVSAAAAQSARWADPNDETAKYMIHMEHLWTDADCTGSVVVETLLADDFQGTAPDGSRYSKKQAVEEARNPKQPARNCQTYEVKVHFFGDSMAILYGSESATRRTSSGAASNRKLVWTDTWLKRNGKWQIVAAQDMQTK